MIECPKCHYVRQLTDNIIPDWQCPKCGIVYAKHQKTETSANVKNIVKVRFVSGYELSFNKIKLYDLSLIKKIESLRQAAANNLGGFSTGLGFFGSLEWVAAGSIVTSVIDSAVSGQMAKQGITQINQIAELSNQLRQTAVFVQVSTIENIGFPDPGMWKAVHKLRRPELAHISSNYVFVESQNKEIVLFWDKIEQYEYLLPDY